MKILICKGNVENAKSYPFWDELDLSGHEVKYLEGILPFVEIRDLVDWCDIWISIDSFLPHFVKYYGLKNGIVLWGTSDPEIFGYPENHNLLKDRKYLRSEQFKWWIGEALNKDAFVSPEQIHSLLDTVVHA